jgi:DNA helicase-2/ATP-dependent DNA helicase PcrA
MGISLNPEQELAANHREGPCLVTAAPGSGKTRVVVERTIRLIESGIPAKNILSITFTNKAAKEMKLRLLPRLGDRAKGMLVCTMHAFCAKLLRFYGHHIGYSPNFVILDEDEQVDTLAQVARQAGYEWKKPVLRALASVMDSQRENLVDEDEMANELRKKDACWPEVAVGYLERLRQKNMLDFSGLLTESVRLLQESQFTLDTVHNRFIWLQVDESQDTNFAQFELVNLMAAKYKNLFLVGDLDQSIYSWRGARPENISDFLTKYENVKIIRLGMNYRSTPQIVEAADKLIRCNPNRVSDDFRTGNPGGAPIACLKFLDNDQEARWVAQSAKRAILAGVPPNKVAVLYRLNRMSRAIEMAMMAEKVPHVIIGGLSFFDRKEVKDHVAMLRLLLNPMDGLSFHRIVNKPTRGLGDVAVGKIEQFAESNNIDLLDACRRAPEYLKAKAAIEGALDIAQVFGFPWRTMLLGECLKTISQRIRYSDYLKSEDPLEADERMGNVEELINHAATYKGSEKSLPSFIDQISLMASADKANEDEAVILMTLHSAKGLEFHTVFMPGFEDDTLPHKKAVEERGGLDEERRLAFVGMTRAEKVLNISYCQQRQDAYASGRGRKAYVPAKPSRFLYEAGLLAEPKTEKKVIEEYI